MNGGRERVPSTSMPRSLDSAADVTLKLGHSTDDRSFIVRTTFSCPGTADEPDERG
jgi:hypothetical protein